MIFDTPDAPIPFPRPAHTIALHVAHPRVVPRLVAELHHHGDRFAVAHPARRPRTWTVGLHARTRADAAELVATALGRAGLGAEIGFADPHDRPSALRAA